MPRVISRLFQFDSVEHHEDWGGREAGSGIVKELLTPVVTRETDRRFYLFIIGAMPGNID